MHRAPALSGVYEGDGTAMQQREAPRQQSLTVEKLGRLARRDLEDEAQRVAKLRGTAEVALVLA